MTRLLLIETAPQLPGLLPLHAWSALMTSDLVLLGAADHPFGPPLADAELRVEVVPEPEAKDAPALSRADLLSGIAPAERARAEWIAARAGQAGDVAYVLGPGDGEAFTRMLALEAARAGAEVEIVYLLHTPKGLALLDLVQVEDRLRGPGGCPWDLEQTHTSLARYAVEEVHELSDAIASGDPEAMREELGDLLLQVVFHARIAEDEGTFDIDAVARGIADKLVRRHPHVFADTEVADADEVMANWDELKAAEKPERTGPFDGVPVGQPALAYAEQLQRRAARTGFDWAADAEAAERVRLELDELVGAADYDARAAELGDVLLSVVGLARRLDVDPEQALRAAAQRFRTRFEWMAAAATRPLDQLDPADWLALWDRAKDRDGAEG